MSLFLFYCPCAGGDEHGHSEHFRPGPVAIIIARRRPQQQRGRVDRGGAGRGPPPGAGAATAARAEPRRDARGRRRWRQERAHLDRVHGDRPAHARVRPRKRDAPAALVPAALPARCLPRDGHAVPPVLLGLPSHARGERGMGAPIPGAGLRGHRAAHRGLDHPHRLLRVFLPPRPQVGVYCHGLGAGHRGFHYRCSAQSVRCARNAQARAAGHGAMGQNS